MSLRTECSLFQRREGFCATERVLKIWCDFMTNFYGCALREIGKKKKLKKTRWGNRCSWHYLMHKSLLGVGGSGGFGMCTTFLFKGFRQKPLQLKWIYLVASNAYCCCYYYFLQTKMPEFVSWIFWCSMRARKGVRSWKCTITYPYWWAKTKPEHFNCPLWQEMIKMHPIYK